MLGLVLHCRVQFEVPLPHRVEIPGKRSDGIGYLEQRPRQRLALRRVGGERDRRTLHGRGRQQFRIAQCIGHAVCCQRVLEIAGIADQCPARPPGLAKKAAAAREDR